MTHNTIEERLRFARHVLVLIEAATTSESADDIVHGETLVEAIHALSIEALEALKPLKDAPSEVLNWDPETVGA